MCSVTFRRSSGCGKINPLRPIRAIVDQALRELSPEFAKMYSKVGRPSIPPEQAVARSAATDAVLGAQRAAADGGAGTTTSCSAGSWD